MKAKKRVLFTTVLMLFVILAVGISAGAATTSKKKAVYSFKTYSATFRGNNSTGKYSFKLPQLKGKSAVVKKINKSLKKVYKASLKDKKRIKETTENSDFSGATFYYTTDCKVTYNKKGVVSFCFTGDWFAGGVRNYWHYGASYSLKTGKKLKITDVVSGNTPQIKKKIANKFASKYANYFGLSADRISETKTTIQQGKLSQLDFYLKNGKVVISWGAYAPVGFNEETPITIKGKY